MRYFFQDLDDSLDGVFDCLGSGFGDCREYGACVSGPPAWRIENVLEERTIWESFRIEH